jgi:hypothetical protein
MEVWLMTDPMFWVTLGAWSGFCTGLFTGALITWWRIKRRGVPTSRQVIAPHRDGGLAR